MNYGIGIDLGGTQIKSARIDLHSGQLLATALLPTRDGEHENHQPAFAAAVGSLVEKHTHEAGCLPALIGIAAPGLAARDGTCIRHLPGKLAGIEGLIWTELLSQPARCLNDAHAALLGEVWQGAAKGKQDVIMLTLGTGVGGAVMSGGHLIQGHTGRAGHLGHVTVDMHGPLDCVGMPGSIEDHIGNASLALRSAGRFSMTRDLLAAVAAGDAEAQALWQYSLKALAICIASLINAFDPQTVILGGGIANAWDAIQPSLDHYLDAYEWRPNGERVSIQHASLGEWAGCYGAVAYAAESPPRH